MSDVELSLSSDATAGCGAQNHRPLASRLTKSYGGEAPWSPVGGPRAGFRSFRTSVFVDEASALQTSNRILGLGSISTWRNRWRSGTGIDVIGGRTKTRTLDPLIKSPIVFLCFQLFSIKASDL